MNAPGIGMGEDPRVPSKAAAVASKAMEWCRGHSYLLAILAITLLAAVVRIYRIESFPPGLHGDEAWTGLDARRVLDEGWIGPYVPSALGQPSGPLYWTAAVFKLLGDGLLQLRLSMALLGIATVPMTYWATRQMFDRRTALVAAVLIAFMGWHIMFSRTAFMVTAQPLLEVVFLGLLFSAYKQESYAFYAAAGAALGLGVYTYNAYPVFVGATGLFAVVLLVVERQRWQTLAPRLGLMFAVAFVVALPLISYIRDEKNDYMAHHRLISVLYKPEFEDEDLPGKARVLIERSVDWAKLMTVEPKGDFTDATGTRTAIIDRLTLGLLLLGVGVCLKRRTPRAPGAACLPARHAGGGNRDAGRRSATFARHGADRGNAGGAAPGQALGVGRAQQRRQAHHRAGNGRLRAAGRRYRQRTHVLPTHRRLGGREVGVRRTAGRGVEVHRDVAGQALRLLLQLRWGYDYETRRYLAPDLKGENRSTEFGKRVNADGEEEPPPLTDFDARVPSVVVLLPAYLDVLDTVESEYPGGHKHVGRNRQGEVLFIAYTLPTARR